MLYRIVLVSAEHQCESAIGILFESQGNRLGWQRFIKTHVIQSHLLVF